MSQVALERAHAHCYVAKKSGFEHISFWVLGFLFLFRVGLVVTILFHTTFQCRRRKDRERVVHLRLTCQRRGVGMFKQYGKRRYKCQHKESAVHTSFYFYLFV